MNRNTDLSFPQFPAIKFIKIHVEKRKQLLVLRYFKLSETFFSLSELVSIYKFKDTGELQDAICEIIELALSRYSKNKKTPPRPSKVRFTYKGTYVPKRVYDLLQVIPLPTTTATINSFSSKANYGAKTLNYLTTLLTKHGQITRTPALPA